VFGIPLLVILLGLWLWWPPHLHPNRSSDLGSDVVGGGIVAFIVLYLEQVLSQRQERNILRLQLSTGDIFDGVDLSNQNLSGFYLPRGLMMQILREWILEKRPFPGQASSEQHSPDPT
jgi:hypothetical protein